MSDAVQGVHHQASTILGDWRPLDAASITGGIGVLHPNGLSQAGSNHVGDGRGAMPPPRPRLRSILPAAVALALAAGCSPRDPYPSVVVDAAGSATPVESMDDPRIAQLLEVARTWREMRGPSREVVDQLVLVADVPTFYSALAAWDERKFYPILIDDPRWTLHFVRAFRPSRILRWPTTPRVGGSGPMDEWGEAGEAVSRAWVEDEPGSTSRPPPGTRPRDLGRTPPGLVLSHPGSPALAGAAALAAGRFQPLVRVGRVVTEDRREEPLGFGSSLTEEQAIAFARRVEARVASVAKAYGELGDDVDFLTLAGDWPFRYDSRRGPGMNRGDRAVDDLLGRELPPGTADVDRSRRRWAYTGRLLGDPAASVYRAMAALFLQPESALLWNTYGGGHPWSDYDVSGAATILRLIRPSADVRAHAGDQAGLASWHETVEGQGGGDLLMMNSSGSPGRFTIRGGPGVPGDVPFGAPSTVSLIHSFSAADPSDPDTIAGRFLDRGAFIYYGSMNEPYLISFRVPYILAQLMVAGVPLGAAFRQGPGEGFGFPWRLVYLGDPLYRIDPDRARDRPRRSDADPPPAGAVILEANARPDSPDAAGTLDWCYEATLLASATLGTAATPDVLDALDDLDRRRLDADRRVRFDALLVDRCLAAGDLPGMLDRLLRIPDRERTPTVWRAIETVAFARLAALLREDRFNDALNLWERIAVAAWRPGSDFPGDLTRRVAEGADRGRLQAFRLRLAGTLDRLDPRTLPPGRREMLEGSLRKLDNDLAR